MCVETNVPVPSNNCKFAAPEVTRGESSQTRFPGQQVIEWPNQHSCIITNAPRAVLLRPHANSQDSSTGIFTTRIPTGPSNKYMFDDGRGTYSRSWNYLGF
jgi:hypothetical protein